MEHLYDGVTFPEPENFLDWGPETNGRSFKGQTLEELVVIDDLGAERDSSYMDSKA